jgi:hypothetical protein
MKKIFFSMLTLIVLSAASMNAQVLIGGDGNSDPDPAAVLELQSSDQGFLLPRVALISTNEPAPLTAFVNGMTVYNTASTGDVTAGTYYCDGYRWIRVRNTYDLIKKSDLSGEVVKLMMDLVKNEGTVTNNCPETVIGNSGISYAVGDYGVAGCWMRENSKEGTPSAKQYGKGTADEKAEGERGYYYTWEQAQTACPPGFSVPSFAQFDQLYAVIGQNAQQIAQWGHISGGGRGWGGFYDSRWHVWSHWGAGIWRAYQKDEIVSLGDRFVIWYSADYCTPTRCVMD